MNIYKKLCKLISVIVVLSVLFCVKKEISNETPKNNESASRKVDTVTAIVEQDSSTIGTFLGTNEEGDYWYFSITSENGEQIDFVYTDETLFSRTTEFAEKKLKVIWESKEFETAGSGEKYTGKLLKRVEIVE
jgi:hypothetical protein